MLCGAASLRTVSLLFFLPAMLAYQSESDGSTREIGQAPREMVFRTMRLGPPAHPLPFWQSTKVQLKDFAHFMFSGDARMPAPGDVVAGRKVEEAEETQVQLRRRFILHPDDPLKIGLDLLVSLCVLASVIEVPLAVGFSLSESLPLLVFESLMDALFMLDMVRTRAKAGSVWRRQCVVFVWGCVWAGLCGHVSRRNRVVVVCISLRMCVLQLVRFRSAFIGPERVVYTVPAAIARHYRVGSLCVDFISSVPLDRIVVAMVSQGAELRSLRLLRVMSLFRLLKLFRIVKFSKLLMKLEQKVHLSPQVLQVGWISLFRCFLHTLCLRSWLLCLSVEASGSGPFGLISELHVVYFYRLCD